MHWLATQVDDWASHALETQSALPPHDEPFAQAGQVPPPQSTAVSVPSLLPFAQVAGAHTVVTVLQTVLLQSLLTAQCCPSAQALQYTPPQSTSVSSKLGVPSKQPAHGVAPIGS